jgi:hypothetical protein
VAITPVSAALKICSRGWATSQQAAKNGESGGTYGAVMSDFLFLIGSAMAGGGWRQRWLGRFWVFVHDGRRVG